jgi:radical SAM protein with 4Fe4S-binding SPASM domain
MTSGGWSWKRKLRRRAEPIDVAPWIGHHPVSVGRPKIASVAVELTAHCNQKCAYCYNEWREDGGAAVGAPRPQKLFDRVDKLLDAIEVDHVTLTGGEPLLHPGVFELLERLRARGIRAQIISNGGLVDEEVAALLAGLGVAQVQVTLNGPEAALHEEHVGKGNGHFARTIAGIEALIRHGVAVVGCIVITRKNATRVGEILERFEAMGVGRISLSRFSPAGYSARNAAELLCSRGDLTLALEQALPFAQKGMDVLVSMPVPPCAVEVERFAPIQFGTCPIGTSAQEIALGPDGRLKNCTLHRTALGGVEDILDPAVDVAALLEAPERRDYRRKLPAFCEGCCHADSCGGGCGAAAEWVMGDARAFPDPFVWQHVDDGLAARFAQARRHLEVIA